MIACYFTLFSLFLVFDLPFRITRDTGLNINLPCQPTLGAWAGDFMKITAFFRAVARAGRIALSPDPVAPDPVDLGLGRVRVVSYFLGKIFPVLIVPLFTNGKVGGPGAGGTDQGLASRYGMPLQNVYSLNLSKTTKRPTPRSAGNRKDKARGVE